MKTTKILATVLAVCMIIAIMPMALAANYATKRVVHLYYMGDVTLDDIVNTGDATMMLKVSSGLEHFTAEQEERQDANADTYYNTADAVYVLCVVAGMEEVNEVTKIVDDETDSDNTDSDNTDSDDTEKYTVHYEMGNLPEGTTVALPADEKVEENAQYTVAAALETVVTETMTYEFANWTAENATYAAGATFTMPAHDVTFTAVWTESSLQPEIPENAVVLNLYDSLNEVEVALKGYAPLTEGMNEVNKTNIVLPYGYILSDESYSAIVTYTEGAAKPAELTVNVTPVTTEDGFTYRIIRTAKGFDNVDKDLSKNYVMGNDIALSSTTNRVPFGWTNVEGEMDTVFTGIFDGKGHTITGLYMDYITDGNGLCSQNIGLFAINLGIIRNLNVYTVNTTESSDAYGVFGDSNVGIIAGSNYGLISDCHTFGNVGTLCTDHTIACAGGIVGRNDMIEDFYEGKDLIGRVENCSFVGGVEGFANLGGLIGINLGVLKTSYFAGVINGDLDEDTAYFYSIEFVGGLCGTAINATIENCYVWDGYCFVAYRAIGGLVGMTQNTSIKSCFVGDPVLFYDTTAGFAGLYVGRALEGTTTVYCYALSTEKANTLPEGFDTTIWDMNAPSLSNLPDLTNNSRGELEYIFG